jgi:hypothetical protein
MSLDIDAITAQMISDSKNVFTSKWPDVKIYAESELRNFVIHLQELDSWKRDGKISEEDAKAMVNLHKRSMKMVFTSCQVISLVLAEKVVNSAVDKIKNLVNSKLGWQLLE